MLPHRFIHHLPGRQQAAIHGAEGTAPDDTTDEHFPHERECRKIVLAFAKKHFGYDHVNRPPFTFPRMVDLTLRHGCGVGRDTIKAILEEADPCSRPSRRRPNRNRSYHKLIYALAHEFCANDDGRLSAKAAEKICRIVREQGDTVTIEAVGEILRDMGRAVKPNW
jgi:hypothetical protein